MWTSWPTEEKNRLWSAQGEGLVVNVIGHEWTCWRNCRWYVAVPMKDVITPPPPPTPPHVNNNVRASTRPTPFTVAPTPQCGHWSGNQWSTLHSLPKKEDADWSGARFSIHGRSSPPGVSQLGHDPASPAGASQILRALASEPLLLEFFLSSNLLKFLFFYNLSYRSPEWRDSRVDVLCGTTKLT